MRSAAHPQQLHRRSGFTLLLIYSSGLSRRLPEEVKQRACNWKDLSYVLQQTGPQVRARNFQQGKGKSYTLEDVLENLLV